MAFMFIRVNMRKSGERQLKFFLGYQWKVDMIISCDSYGALKVSLVTFCR